MRFMAIALNQQHLRIDPSSPQNWGPIERPLQNHMDVSENSEVFPPNHPIFNRVFHYKPSILGAHPYVWKHPYH